MKGSPQRQPLARSGAGRSAGRHLARWSTPGAGFARLPLWLFMVLQLLPHAAPVAAQQPSGVFSVRSMTPETALQAARGALEHCRGLGFQVAVAVVDRSGVVQVVLRDRFAGAHTVEVAGHKARTAASFKVPTALLAAETQPGKPLSGLRAQPGVLAVAGGQPVEGGGSLLGGIGVSGAPGGDADDACALAGIRAVAGELEF